MASLSNLPASFLAELHKSIILSSSRKKEAVENGQPIYLQGKSIRAIAKETGIPKSTVARRINSLNEPPEIEVSQNGSPPEELCTVDFRFGTPDTSEAESASQPLSGQSSDGHSSNLREDWKNDPPPDPPVKTQVLSEPSRDTPVFEALFNWNLRTKDQRRDEIRQHAAVLELLSELSDDHPL